MNKHTNTMNLLVTRDGEVDRELSGLPDARTIAVDTFKQAIGYIGLELKMLAYDSLHSTHYRTIRHELVRQERNKQFETAIGLVAIKK